MWYMPFSLPSATSLAKLSVMISTPLSLCSPPIICGGSANLISRTEEPTRSTPLPSPSSKVAETASIGETTLESVVGTSARIRGGLVS